MTGSYILALLLIYLLGLFVVAWRADRALKGRERPRRRKLIYTLSLAVLCTSLSYFRAVGTASRDGWSYLPNLLGPALGFALLFPIWMRVAAAAKRENVGSIADFLSSRYGKSRPLGTVIAFVALIAALPYIAVQLITLAQAWGRVTGGTDPPPFALPIIVAALAGFAILLGARRPTLTAHNPGLVRAVAIESVVKLAGLFAVAGLAIFLLAGSTAWRAGGAAFGALAHAPALNLGFFTTTFLGMVTVATMPRQFHLTFVELEDIDDLKTARWLLPLYMALIALAVPVIAVAGRALLQGDPDMYVVCLPLKYAGAALTGLALLGGFSASASMVMVETVALSAMISNELVLPLMNRLRRPPQRSIDIGRLIVNIRRAAIVGILLLAWAYFQAIQSSTGIARLGQTALAASAQLVPALMGAVIWRRGHSSGAITGIVGGMVIWAFMMAIPQFAPGWNVAVVGPDTPPAIGVLLSLAVNLALYVGVSLAVRPRLVDRIQAAAFVGEPSPAALAGAREMRGTVGDLRTLVEQFLGSSDAQRAFEDFKTSRGRQLRDSDPVDPTTARAAERMLAGAIGGSSARSVIQWALADTGREPADVGRILDEAAQAVHFSRELLQTTLDSLVQAVVVVDAEQRLLAWNRPYLALFSIPHEQLIVGKPIEDVIRANTVGTPLEVEQLIESRLGPMRRHQPQDFERDWATGLTLKVVGQPLGTGEYVTSFTDVTELRATARALGQANEELDDRVRARTAELTKANEALASATALAEKATSSQVRFVAAASHDLLQPLNAARLFIGAVSEETPERSTSRELLQKADLSIDAADRLLRALLNLSRLEFDGVKPTFSPVAAGPLLQALCREFEPVATEKGITLRAAVTDLWVQSDPDLLRSVLQNLIGNAVRYTTAGGVLIGCRRDGSGVRFEVRDSGPGISGDEIPMIFKEFHRLQAGVNAAPGAGLGLAIVERICVALGHPLAVRSQPGQGSTFSVTAPRAAHGHAGSAANTPSVLPRRLSVLCVENEPFILQAMQTLLGRWGATVDVATSAEEATALAGPWDVILADFHLGAGADGLALLELLRGRGAVRALVTASPNEDLLARATGLGIAVLRKPIAPASLRAFLTHASEFRPAAE